MRKKIGLIVVSIVLIGGIGSYLYFKKKNMHKSGEPLQSVEEILKERANHAESHLLTPMGKSFISKNWIEFEKLYQPKKDFHELAEIIRACFIGNRFNGFEKKEMDRVLGYVIKAFDEIQSQNFPLTGLLITQFNRLPTPSHESDNYKKIESWYQDENSNQAKKKMAVLKLGIQDSEPTEKWINAVIQGVTGKTFGVTHSSWIQMVLEMRNIPARTKVLDSILKNFSKIELEAKGEALIVLASCPPISLKNVKIVFFKFLDSKDQKYFESALKSLLPLKNENAFNSDEMIRIKDRLNDIPDGVKNPYVEAKAKELLKEFN